ncbi:MAG: TadE/TadG family type IV pilus assembly protein [Myxococcaceae bacterium]
MAHLLINSSPKRTSVHSTDAFWGALRDDGGIVLGLRHQRSRPGHRGQAAVETVIIMPLVLFFVLGTIQLSLLMHARIMAHYAAFKATRAGSVNHGDCVRMTQAALAAIVPNVTSFMAPNVVPGGTPADRFVAAFTLLRDRQNGAGAEPFVPLWIFRESPLPGVIGPDGQDNDFDDPTTTPEEQRLEVRLIYWYRMRIPWASNVISWIIRAHYGFVGNPGINFLVPVRPATEWDQNPNTFQDAAVGAEMNTRMTAGQLDVPIPASYTMRMMTPAKQVFFQTQNCPPVP